MTAYLRYEQILLYEKSKNLFALSTGKEAAIGLRITEQKTSDPIQFKKYHKLAAVGFQISQKSKAICKSVFEVGSQFSSRQNCADSQCAVLQIGITVHDFARVHRKQRRNVKINCIAFPMINQRVRSFRLI